MPSPCARSNNSASVELPSVKTKIAPRSRGGTRLAGEAETASGEDARTATASSASNEPRGASR